MNILEKILEEIEDVRKIMKSTVATNCFGKECENDDCTVCVCERVIEIIRSHMNDVTDTNVGSKNNWIPCSERLPEDGEEMVLIQVSGKPTENIQFEDAFEFAYYKKEEGWILEYYPEWKNPEVVAWMPLLEPYKVEEMKTDIFNANNKNYPIYEYRGCWLPEEIEKMNLIEQALGIKLFTWQKSYIKNGNFRCSGKTTAVIIRILTQGKEPVDLRNREKIQKYVMMDTPWIATGPVCGVFKREVKEIHEKLLTAGVKTNPVFYTEMDRKKFLRKEEKDE